MILSIVSGTFNRLEYLQAMMASARKSLPPNWTAGVEYEFSICDGGSTDGTLEWLRGQAGVTLTEHGELRGAIKAFNDAAAAAKGDYLCIANDDVEFKGLTIANGLAQMIDNPELGAGCFYQDRGGKDLHVEKMPILRGNEQHWLPYLQVGLIPKWLWDKCGGWGDWGGRTYGGDNYLSGRVYESGYQVHALQGCAISDKTPLDALRRQNNTNNKDGQILWAKFPDGFHVPDGPIYPNPLPERKRVLYAPIIEAGHDVQKAQKRGLRDALGALGLVWEVDYIFSKESIKDAVEAWKPHYILTQFHTATATNIEEVAALRTHCQGYMVNWSGDVWQEQSDPAMMEILRHFDCHLTVNAALLPRYDACGIQAEYWQNAWEPQIAETDDAGEPCDALFIGNNYSHYRLELAQTLKALPYNIRIYGRGYPEGLSEGESLYNFRKTGQLYRGAKIAIADNQFPDATGFASDRMFMILASGNCCMFHQRVDQMEHLLGLKAGVHYVEWVNQEDLKEKIAYYLEHEDERKAIADAGTREGRANHSFGKRVEQLENLFKSIPKRTTTVSAILICKNEEANIETCINQLRWAHEIIVVDTGSTDSTQAKVDSLVAAGGLDHLHRYTFVWDDDFSAARNFAKSKATSDWIFWCDADDEIPSETLTWLQKFDTWSFRSLGIQNPGAYKLWLSTGEQGQGAFQTRLFKNIPLIEWRKRVQETVDESLKDLGVTTLALSKVVLYHKTPTPEMLLQKQARNLRLLELEPPSPWRDYQKAASYAAMERWGDAFLWFEIAEREEKDDEFKAFLGFCGGYALYKAGLRSLALMKFRGTDFPDALFLRAELEAEAGAFMADLYKRFLRAPTPVLFPTYSRAWRPWARKTLMDWHRREIEALLTAP